MDSYYTCAIFSGIVNEIDFEIKYGTADRRKEIRYMVERYCEEEIVSGKFLREKAEEYYKIAEEKYGTEEN